MPRVIPSLDRPAAVEKPPRFAPPSVAPLPSQVATDPRSGLGRVRPAVEDSADLRRVLALPRRPVPDEAQRETWNRHYTTRLGRGDRGNCECASLNRTCITKLHLAQGWTLHEAETCGGVLGFLPVGVGKTACDILVPMVLKDCRVVALLVPPKLVPQLLLDYAALAEHWHVPSLVPPKGYSGARVYPGRPVIHVVPYSTLSRAEATVLLEALRPDTIVGDEYHKLRHPKSSTAARVLRYDAAHKPRNLGWSGSLMRNSPKNFAHLAAMTLRDGSPLPLELPVVDEWHLALAAVDWRAPPGELIRLCEPGESVEQGFFRRLVETPGVVSMQASGCSVPLVIEEREPPEMPDRVAELIDQVRSTGVRPDGEELEDQLAISRCVRELASGFFYRWKFPRGEPPPLIDAWFAARKAWHKELRAFTQPMLPHLDSALLATKAAIRAYQDPPYEGEAPVWPAQHWPAWRELRDQVYHEGEAIWVDDWLAQDAAEWVRETKGVVWYWTTAFGQRVAELSGAGFHPGGPGAGPRLAAERGKRGVVCSVQAHGTGTDGLQRVFREQLIAEWPQGDVEQLLGRLHRPGQAAEEVTTYVYRHVPEIREAFKKSMREARATKYQTGGDQKLLIADLGFEG